MSIAEQVIMWKAIGVMHVVVLHFGIVDGLFRLWIGAGRSVNERRRGWFWGDVIPGTAMLLGAAYLAILTGQITVVADMFVLQAYVVFCMVTGELAKRHRRRAEY